MTGTIARTKKTMFIARRLNENISSTTWCFHQDKYICISCWCNWICCCEKKKKQRFVSSQEINLYISHQKLTKLKFTSRLITIIQHNRVMTCNQTKKRSFLKCDMRPFHALGDILINISDKLIENILLRWKDTNGDYQVVPFLWANYCEMHIRTHAHYNYLRHFTFTYIVL